MYAKLTHLDIIMKHAYTIFQKYSSNIKRDILFDWPFYKVFSYSITQIVTEKVMDLAIDFAKPLTHMKNYFMKSFFSPNNHQSYPCPS